MRNVCFITILGNGERWAMGEILPMRLYCHYPKRIVY